MNSLLTVKQVAELVNASGNWVRSAIYAGKLPAINIGLAEQRSEWRIQEADLVAFLSKNRRNAPSEGAAVKVPPFQSGCTSMSDISR